MLILYLAGINGSLRAISVTNLTATSIYELEHSILAKTSKLSTALLEDPATKTIREKAKRLSLIDLLDQWTGVTIHFITLIALIVVLSCYGFYILKNVHFSSTNSAALPHQMDVSESRGLFQRIKPPLYE